MTKTARHALCALILLLMSAGWALPSSAQTPAPPTPTPPASAMRIHVVQRGETLFSIARLYGTTVEAIAAANSLTDPTLISVGQRLIVPGSEAPGATAQYVVRLGDTLADIAFRFRARPEDIARLNGIANPTLLIAGASLAVPNGTGEAAPPAQAQRVHIVEPGETLVGVAAAAGRSLWEIALANGLPMAQPVYPGERLALPGGSRQVVPSSPFATLAAHPLPAVQGRAFAVDVGGNQGGLPPVGLSGRFADQPLRFVTEVSKSWTLVGLNAFTPAGLYPLVITATLPGGEHAVFQQMVQVVEPGYSSEEITLDPQTSQLLDPKLIAAENAIVMAVFRQFTPQRLWHGLFALPTPGEITSPFGIRRSYNGGPYSSYHEGTDLNGRVGDPIYAAAAGRVALAQKLTVRGNAIILDHGSGVFTGYWHLSKILVNVGDLVEPGQHIADMGATGLVTGPHLHWELRINGIPVDAMQWTREIMP